MLTAHPGKFSFVQQNDYLFQQITGITVQQFKALFIQFNEIYEKEELKRLSRNTRKRAIGAGNKFKLCLEDRLLMVLMYYRLYTTQIFSGKMIFDIDDSNVSRAFRKITPILAKIFKIPERRITMTENEIMEIFIDGTEQPINRPKNRQAQKKYYSGKKKRHTIKHQVICGKNKKIKAVSKAYPGRDHDKKVYDKTRLVKPRCVKGYGDSGYEGTDLTRPKKKPKGRKLTEEEKKINKEISSKRVVVENAICVMKRYRIISDKYRNERGLHTMIFKNTAGLANLRIA